MGMTIQERKVMIINEEKTKAIERKIVCYIWTVETIYLYTSTWEAFHQSWEMDKRKEKATAYLSRINKTILGQSKIY